MRSQGVSLRPSQLQYLFLSYRGLRERLRCSHDLMSFRNLFLVDRASINRVVLALSNKREILSKDMTPGIIEMFYLVSRSHVILSLYSSIERLPNKEHFIIPGGRTKP